MMEEHHKAAVKRWHWRNMLSPNCKIDLSIYQAEWCPFNLCSFVLQCKSGYSMHLALLCVCHKFWLCSTEIAAEIFIYLFLPQAAHSIPKTKNFRVLASLSPSDWYLGCSCPPTEMWTSSQQFMQHILSSLHALLVFLVSYLSCLGLHGNPSPPFQHALWDAWL